MLLVTERGRVLLERRPPTGIWGGLLCLPQADDAAAAQVLASALGGDWGARLALPAIKHGFTHYHLTIQPLRMAARRGTPRATLAAEQSFVWLDLEEACDAGVPAPVKKLLASVRTGSPSARSHAA